MNATPPPRPAVPAFSSVAIIGVGRAGTAMLAQVRAAGVPAEACLATFSRHTGETCAVETGVCALPATALEAFSAVQPASLAAVEPGLAEAVRRHCSGRLWVLVLTGLGGRTSSLLAPLIAAEARQSCDRVVSFASLPASDEGGERVQRGRRALASLSRWSEGVVCLPQNELGDRVDADAPLTVTFELAGRLLAEAAQGFWRMLSATPVIRLHADELRDHLRGEPCGVFAAVEAGGPERARAAVEKLLAHPLLAGGAALRGTRVVVSVVSGSGPSRADVREVVQRVESAAESVCVMLCAGTAPELQDRLAVMLLARADSVAQEQAPTAEPAAPDAAAAPRFVPANEPAGAPPLGTRTHSPSTEGARIETSVPAGRRRSNRSPQQVQLPLELASRSRFDKSEPTIHNGENLDLPTYLRHGIPLN